MHTLNPHLFEILQAAFSNPRISHPGEERLVRYVPDFDNPKYLQTQVDQYGEQYTVDCPFCGDQRGRLNISYCFGIRDPRTNSPNRHLFHCFNEQCHQDAANREQLFQELFRAGYRPGKRAGSNPVTAHPIEAAPPLDPRMPTTAVLLHQLSPKHAACQYLVGRGFDPVEMAVRWGVCFCDESLDTKPIFSERIVIPVHRLRDVDDPAPELAGWVARSLVAQPDDEGPKYLNSAGMSKSSLLYGLPQALKSLGPVVICEGVTDCWAYGPGAVALLGKTISARQIALLNRWFPKRPIVVLLDADAEAEAEDVLRQLQPARQHLGTIGRVVLGKLPPEYSDPGECSREVLLCAVAQALKRTRTLLGVGIPYQVLGGTKTRLTSTDRPQHADSIVLSYAVQDDRLVGAAVVDKAGMPHYAARNIRKVLESLGNDHRVYFDALSARLIEHKFGLPASETFDDLHIMSRLLDGDGVSTDDLLRPHELIIPLRALSAAQPHAEQALHQALAIRHRFAALNQRLNREGRAMLYREIELPVIEPTVAMITNGLRVDAAWLQAERQRLNKRQEPTHVVDGLLAAVDPETERIHCQLDPQGTATGRFSCSNPPLQAVSKRLRRAFVASPGYVLLEADFSQMELRVLAELSGDKALLYAFGSDADVHVKTALAVLHLPPRMIRERERAVGKWVNFAIVNGSTASGLAERLKISLTEAEALIEDWYRAYPKVGPWREMIVQLAADRSYVHTLYGRRRHIPHPGDDASVAKRAAAARQAVNTVVQGTAADINKLSLARLHKALPPSCRLLLSVHDSVLLEVPEGESQAIQKLVRDVMEQPPPRFTVPIKVEVKVGSNWAACKKAG